MDVKRRTALYGLLVALAFVCSFLESLFPLPLPLPGIKLGLANGVVLVTLCLLGPRSALAVSLVRIVLVAFTFGSPLSGLYSLAGGMISLLVMWLCHRSGRFGLPGVSLAGGVSHNVAQLAVAAAVLGTPSVLWYLPALLVAGGLTGWLLGWLSSLLLPRLQSKREE